MADIPKYALLEFERRWLVDLTAVGCLEAYPYRDIDDLYISGTRVRLRKITEPDAPSIFKLGKKYGKQTSISEPITNLYLSELEYLLFVYFPGYRIQKRRYSIQGGALDVYSEPVQAAIFEVEFADEETAEAYKPPSFVSREITDDPSFTGISLAEKLRHSYTIVVFTMIY